jgi:hypothetical protein
MGLFVLSYVDSVGMSRATMVVYRMFWGYVVVVDPLFTIYSGFHSHSKSTDVCRSTHMDDPVRALPLILVH